MRKMGKTGRHVSRDAEATSSGTVQSTPAASVACAAGKAESFAAVFDRDSPMGRQTENEAVPDNL